MIRILGLLQIFNLGFPGRNDLRATFACAPHYLRALGSGMGLAAVLLGVGCERMGVPRADLIIANAVEPESLDPIIMTGQADARVVDCLFEGLVRTDPVTATPIPGLAESWTISTDKRTYTFKLRDGLVWSDNKPITAFDFEHSWHRALDIENGVRNAGLMYSIEGAEAFHNQSDGTRTPPPSFKALDSTTFEVTLTRPQSFFLQLLTMPLFAVTPTHAIQASPDRWLLHKSVPVSGAYELVWWRLNDSIRVRRNRNYWDDENTQNELVDFLPISNPSTAMNLYLMGQVDVIWDKDLIPTHIVDKLIDRSDFHQFNYLGTYFLRFNTTVYPLNSSKVRRALSLAIDRSRITGRITRANEKAATSFIPEGVMNYHFEEAPLLHDPALARKLLADAGFPNGKDFPQIEYYFNGASSGPASNHQKIAVELQAMWKAYLNIDVRLKKNEWKVFLADQEALKYQISRSSWIGDYNDAYSFLEIFNSQESNNRTGWKNLEYDKLLKSSNESLDQEVRRKIFVDAEKLLLDECPIAPLYFYKGTHMFDATKISGIYFNILDRHPVRSIRNTIQERNK